LALAIALSTFFQLIATLMVIVRRTEGKQAGRVERNSGGFAGS